MATKAQLEKAITKAHQEIEDIRTQLDLLSAKTEVSSTHMKALADAHNNIRPYRKLLSELEKISIKFDFNKYKDQLSTIDSNDKSIRAFHESALDKEKGYKAKFEALKATLEELVSKSKLDTSNITHGHTGFKVQAERALKECNKSREAISKYQDQLLKGSAQQPAISETIKSAQEDAKAKLDDIKTFHDELLKEIPSQKHASLKSKIKDYENTLADLKEKMHGLLPQVAGASLSHAYFDAKSYHGPTRPRKAEEKSEHWWVDEIKTICKYVGGYLKPAFFYFIFIGPIIFTIMMFAPVFLGASLYEILIDGSEVNAVAFADINWWGVFFRFLIAIPMGIISLFGHNSISRSRRLYEEYDHKQRVMELYTGFGREAEQLGQLDESHKSDLMKIVLETVEDKPLSIRHNAQQRGTRNPSTPHEESQRSLEQ